MSLPAYPRYRDTAPPLPLRVPEHWQTGAFKRLASVQNGADYKHIESADGVPVYGSGGPFAYATDWMHDGASVLLGRKGTVDRPIFVTGKFWCVDTMFWTTLATGASPKYVYYLASTIPFGLYSTNTALPSMAKGDLENHPVVAPPLSEQTAISRFLDCETTKIDCLITEQERLIALLTEKRQAVISHTVTKGLDPNVPMKNSGLEWVGQIPRHWTLPPVADRYRVELGKMLDEKRIDGEHLLPYLRNVNVQWDAIESNELPEMDVEPSEYERYLLQAGDLLVCEGGEVGRAAIWDGRFAPCAYQKALHRLRPRRSSEIPRFMLYTLRHAVAMGVFTANGNQNTIPHLTAQQLRRYRFPTPPEMEQRAIVEHLDHHTRLLDSAVADAEHAVELLRERRTALITAAVTGQIDVRGLVETAA